MAAQKEKLFVTIFVLIVLCANLLNVQVARADGETPTEPPAPNQVETEAPPPTESPIEVEATAVPVESTLAPEETATPPAEELLTQVPASTELVVLDEGGDSVPLATQEAAAIIEVFDPMWCPAGVLPGGSGCSRNFGSIGELISSMSMDPSPYNENGIIYFKETTGAETTGDSFVLTTSSLGAGNFNTLNDFNLTLQGGWNGQNDMAATFAGQTNFGTNSITIGETGATANRWVGNVTLNNFLFSGGSQPSVNIYTTSGSITLTNVDVLDHQGGTNTAILDSTSANIVVQNGSTFDGNDSNSNGFSARTAGTGSITISDTSFTEIEQNGSPTYDGASLSAPTVTLTNVTAKWNDGNGIRIDNTNLVTLNQVIASNNGTGNLGSGVFVNGYLGSRVIIIGGEFNNNRRYGVQVGNTTRTTIYIQSAPICEGNRIPGCSNGLVIFDNTAPVIKPIISGTLGTGGSYRSDVSVSWFVTDPEPVSGILSSSGCGSTTLTAETSGTTLTCSAMNNAGLSTSESVTIRIDRTAPILTLPTNLTVEATEPTGAAISYPASAMDGMDSLVLVSCSPVSGSVFPLGQTTVNCSATDSTGNITNAAFLVAVQDTTAPSIAPHPDIIADARGKTGANVSYTSPSTLDAVDGIGTASCSPASGSFFEIGTTQVICTATDAHGNSVTSTFFVLLDRQDKTSVPQPSTSIAIIVPLTGGEIINLDCNNVFWAFGIKLSFINLCEQQTKVNEVTTSDVPTLLPAGSSFVMGLSVDVLTDGELLKEFPDSSSIQMDFPLAGGAKAQFSVLHWNGGEWVEVSPRNSSDPSMLSITTNMAGIFVLVKK